MNELPTFNDMPMVVARTLDEVLGLRKDLRTFIEAFTAKKTEDRHRPMSVEEASAYLRIPKNTLYAKLDDGSIPGSRPGKRWVLYQDELDKWVEVYRRNEVPLTAEEENAAIMASHRRKPKRHQP